MKNSKTKFFCFTISFIMAIAVLISSSAVFVMAEDATSEPQNGEQPVYCFLGSSVTYGHTTGGVSFVDYLAKDNGWKCIKRAVSGTTLVDNGPDSYVQRMKKQIRTSQKIDHFICQLSTNDATQKKPLGTVSDSRNMDDFNTSTVTGAMEYIIAYVYETWDCPVTFYTNPYYNNKDYEKMIDALYKLQEKWDIGIIDFYYYKDMEELSQQKLSSYMSDPIHPNSRGYRWMADVMNEYFAKQNTEPEPTPSPEPTESNNESDDTTKTEKNNNTLLYIIIFSSVGGVLAVAVVILALRAKK